MSGCNTCRCDNTLANTGVGCKPIMGVAEKLVLVPYFDNAGNINSITLSSTLNKAYFDALVNQTDKSKRWYPLPKFENVLNERAENVVETFEDGGKYFVKPGTRSYKGWLIDGSPQMEGKLNNLKCSEIGVFMIDNRGNLIGMIDETGLKLNPVKIDSQSVMARFINMGYAASGKIEFGFDFDSAELDRNLRMITCDTIDYNLRLQLEGLLDMQVTYSSIDTTSFIATLFVDDGVSTTKVPVKGLVKADFTLANLTTPAAITITSVTEVTDGTYTFVIPVVTPGDDLELTPTKAKYDTSLVVASVISVPLS